VEVASELELEHVEEMLDNGGLSTDDDEEVLRHVKELPESLMVRALVMMVGQAKNWERKKDALQEECDELEEEKIGLVGEKEVWEEKEGELEGEKQGLEEERDELELKKGVLEGELGEKEELLVGLTQELEQLLKRYKVLMELHGELGEREKRSLELGYVVEEVACG